MLGHLFLWLEDLPDFAPVRAYVRKTHVINHDDDDVGAYSR